MVENSKGEKVVYLPTFGHKGVVGKYKYDNTHLAKVDDHMQKMWKDELNFDPKMLGDFNPFAVRQGVVHCIKKYLQRD